MIKKITLIAIVVGSIACSNTSKVKAKKKNKAASEEASVFNKQASLQIGVHKFDVEIADNSRKRAFGLMYRKSMQENQGMLFIMESEATQKFWMKNTYIPLDIIFIDSHQKIVDVVKQAQPFALDLPSSKLPARYVLELNGGMFDKLQLKEGQKVEWKRIDQ